MQILLRAAASPKSGMTGPKADTQRRQEHEHSLFSQVITGLSELFRVGGRTT
jgi:hypothetical protein